MGHIYIYIVYRVKLQQIIKDREPVVESTKIHTWNKWMAATTEQNVSNSGSNFVPDRKQTMKDRIHE